MLRISCFHMNTHTETSAPLITCVIDDTLLKTMPDIDQVMLLFIDVMNLVDLLLHFSSSFVVKRVRIGRQRCGKIKERLVSVVSEG